MKTAVLFYTSHADDWCITRISHWGHSLPDIAAIAFCGPEAAKASALVPGAMLSSVSVTDTLSLLAALEEVSHAPVDSDGSGSNTIDHVIFAFGDSPFYDRELTEKLYDQHTRYAAEYSFADGYPQGIVPEIICTGTIGIVKALASGGASPAIAAAASAPVSRECLFNLLKTDINSFEIETLLSPKDFRNWRLDFSVATQEGRIICDRLRTLVTDDMTAIDLCNAAVADSTVLHPVPAFVNFQISGTCGNHTCTYCPYSKFASTDGAFMNLSQFKTVLKKMADSIEQCTIGLGLWGEPLAHPEFPSFVESVLTETSYTVLVETSLSCFNQEVIQRIASLPCAAQRITWICSLDAVTEETWQCIHPESDFTLAEAERRSDFIQSLFPGKTYTQFIRLNENEQELESFYRTHTNRLIQKYDDFCHTLPDRKPADLSPVLRFPCWHLRRDLSVLLNGDVPSCREHLSDDILGNIFSDSLSEIWKKTEELLQQHMTDTLCENCRNCDEYYTFNF